MIWGSLTEGRSSISFKGWVCLLFWKSYISDIRKNQSGCLVQHSSFSWRAIDMLLWQKISPKKKELEVLWTKSNRLSGVGSWKIDVLNGKPFFGSDITQGDPEVGPWFCPWFITWVLVIFKEAISEITISKSGISSGYEKETPWDEELQDSYS